MEQRTANYMPQPNHSKPVLRAGREAFNLIEVMLALMVVSVGILAILALFPMGLDQNARSIGDTYIALFADEVLNGLRTVADDDWDALNKDISLPIAASAKFTTVEPTEFSGADVYTNIYNNDWQSDPDIINHALRYRLELGTRGDNIKTATLWVWSGQWGTTKAPSIFYAEFFNNKPQ